MRSHRMRSHVLARAVLLVLVPILLGGPLRADEALPGPGAPSEGSEPPGAGGDATAPGVDAVRPGKDVTFRGYPAPETQWFFLLQTGVNYLVDAEDEPARLTIDAGLMKNVGPRWAVGVNAHVESGDGEGGYGALLRGRRWLSRSVSADLATGFLVPEDGSAAYANGGNTTSWITQAGLNLGNVLMVTAQMERWKDEDFSYTPSGYQTFTNTGTDWRVGGSFQYLPGVIAFLGFGVLLAATW